MCSPVRRSQVAFVALAIALSVTRTSTRRQPDRAQVLAAMKRATTFMVEKVANKGGYVWSYLPDMTRRWGEMEATPTMIWIQPPGTPSMGHLFLDAYHATGDDYYYRAAEQVASALMFAQHPSGGWNYIADFAGEASLREVVRHHRQERLASRRVSALLRQRHVRRCRHRRIGEVLPASLRREEGSEIQGAARQGDQVRARQPVSDRRLAAALSEGPGRGAARAARLHRLRDVQRRCRGREHGFSADVLPGVRRRAADRSDHPRHERVHRHAARSATAGAGACSTRSICSRPARAPTSRRRSSRTPPRPTSAC